MFYLLKLVMFYVADRNSSGPVSSSAQYVVKVVSHLSLSLSLC